MQEENGRRDRMVVMNETKIVETHKKCVRSEDKLDFMFVAHGI